MRIRIGEFWLAGDPAKDEREHSQCGGLVFPPARQIQVAEGCRWSNAIPYDRANDLESVEFDTTRLFTRFVDCLSFCQSYKGLHPFEGTVTFHESNGDGSYLEFDLFGAVIQRPVLAPVGVSLPIHYRIYGQMWSEIRTGIYQPITSEAGEYITSEDGTVIIWT